MKTLDQLVKKDYPRNYFVALSLAKDPSCYQKVYTFDGHYLLHRKSGNLQFIYDYGNYDAVQKTLDSIDFDVLIGPASTCRALGLKIKKAGAYIAELKKENYVYQASEARPLEVQDLFQIESLYKKTFTGYPKIDYMTNKLLSKRGIGYVVDLDEIVAVAQSDFHQLIVGVATHPDYQHMGYATKCMHALLNKMFETNDVVYLQYDDEIAGKLYKKLGFQVIDQVMHYER